MFEHAYNELHRLEILKNSLRNADQIVIASGSAFSPELKCGRLQSIAPAKTKRYIAALRPQ
jgi:hypothetical protein